MMELVLKGRARGGLWLDMVSLVLGAGLVAALARISLPLPFSPVPITGQTLGVLLAGALLGSYRGFGSMMLYLTLGASGLPVFALGGAGPAWLLGPTGGYLMAFPLAAALAGVLAERRWNRNYLLSVASFALASLPIYLIGTAWLGFYVPDPVGAGILPFLPGDLLKICLAGVALSGLSSLRALGPLRFH